MARLLAIEWDSREARVVVAQARRGDFVLEQAFAIDLRPAEGMEARPESSLGKALSAALAERKIERGEVLVAVGRTNIELRKLTLPPAPADEQPDLVRFQALKQFTTLGDDWPIDFVPLQGENSGQLSVLAAAISPELVAQIRATCSAATLEPKRLVLRPFAAAALLRRRRSVDGCVLVVDMLADEADLTVVNSGNVELIRTVRLPSSSEPEDQARFMSGEIRRTIAAASNQLAGRKVERVVICGDSLDHAILRTQIEQLPGLSVELFDPFEGVALASDAQAIRPPHVGRYAPLLGILVCEASGAAHDIDFLNPRRRPPAPSHRRRNTIMAAVAAVVVLMIAFYYWQAYSELDHQVVTLAKEISLLKDDSKRLDPILTRTANVDEFVAGDVTWLDELRILSERFLPPEEAIVGQLTMSPTPRGGAGGAMTLEGHVRSSSHLVQLESKLRDEQHKVSLGNGRVDEKNRGLPWKFDGSIGVTTSDDDTPNKPGPRPATRPGRTER